VVAVPDPPTGTAWSTTTGAVGTYTLSGLPLGNYLVSAFAKDYARQFYYGHDFAAQAENVTLGSGGRSDVNFQLKYGAGRILGHVYGANMAPVNQAQLEAYLLVGGSWIVAYRARSSSDGSYVMPSVLPGSYRVKAFPSGYVPEWYQGTYVEGAAKLVPVTTFADTIDIDFTLEPTPVAEAGGPYLGQAGLSLTLNGVAYYDPGRPIVSWNWEFGDGSTGSGASANHTYQAAGIYTAKLTVTDTMGTQATDTATVVIWSYCFADQERGTKLYINTSSQTFQFIAPDKEFAVKKATRMEVIDLTKVSAMIYDARTKKWRIDSKKLSLDNDIKPFVELQRWDNKPDKIILIFHRDEELMLSALVLDGTQDSCVAVAKDMKTSKFYILIDRPDLKRLK